MKGRPGRMNEDDNEEGEDSIQGNFLVPYRKKVVRSQMTFPLDEDIGPPAKYRNLILTCVEAEEGDQIRLIINSNGGNLDTCLSICDNLKETSADTFCIISGSCHSAASAIALACQQVAVLPSSSMLIHNARYATGGKAADIEAHVSFSKKQLSRWIESTYKDFLSAVEIKDVIAGKELFLDSEEIVERLKARQAIQEARHAELQAEKEAELKAVEEEIARRKAKPKAKKAKA